MYSTFTPTYLDPAPTLQYDLLGSAFAVLHDVADATQAAEIVSRYPHLPKGAPVIWPQQQNVPIYHNRGIWPFVTSFWAKAAAKAGNAVAVDNSVRALMRGAQFVAHGKLRGGDGSQLGGRRQYERSGGEFATATLERGWVCWNGPRRIVRVRSDADGIAVCPEDHA
jgi:hypothetical protein